MISSLETSLAASSSEETVLLMWLGTSCWVAVVSSANVNAAVSVHLTLLRRCLCWVMTLFWMVVPLTVALAVVV
jgi:hypothetical protein